MKKESKGIVRECLTLAGNLFMLIVICVLGLIGYLLHAAIRFMCAIRHIYFKLMRATLTLMKPSTSDKLKWNNVMWSMSTDNTDDAQRLIKLDF